MLALLTSPIGATPASSTSGPPPMNRYESPCSYPKESNIFKLSEIIGQISLVIPDNKGGTSSPPICSALAISPHLVLTARHCFEDETGGTRSYTFVFVTFGSSPCEKLRTFELHHDRVDPVPGTDDDDFAVLRSDSEIKSSAYALLSQGSPPIAKASLFVLHYPGAGPLVVTALDCHAAEPPIDGIWLRHGCDTEPASSGGPIFETDHGRLVGIQRRGGKDQDPKSFNTGLLLNEIAKKSRIVREALESAGASGGGQPNAALSTVTVEFQISGGAKIVREGQAWAFYGLSGADRPSSPLVLISQNNDEFLFWNPQRDIYLRVPRDGGHVRSRTAEQDIEWTDIGEAVRKK
jgi:V8-like Glu-specific endopeptidase